MTPETLRAFSTRVAAAAGLSKGPIHLSGGNEQPLINYFDEKFRPGDWVFSTWRSHYHALLAGIDEDILFSSILAGHSIALRFPAYRFYCSAIVAGHIPQAVGAALALNRVSSHATSKRAPHVHCFLGDMAAETGLFHEAQKYARNHALPITFVIEDNGLSVCTPTEEVWNNKLTPIDSPTLWHYRYRLTWPHSGAQQRTEF